MSTDLGGAPRQPTSLRSQLRKALLQAFSAGSHGTVEEVTALVKSNRGAAKREAFQAAAGTLTIQVAQLRNELLEAVGVRLERSGGRLTKDQIAEIKRQLGLKTVQKRLAALLETEEVVVGRKAA